MEQIDNFFGNLFDNLREHPRYGLLVAMALVVLYLLGLIFGWKWTMLPSGSGDFTKMWVELLGRKAIRIVKGILALLLLFALGYLYWHYR
ncbi:MAG: immunity 17 family protein [Prevotellaceae bacterium]|nr:immunity 17 family protein [Prevotellaceae bacterium]MDY6131340.1 immunity 17 family protein [Prevotella sp.]